MEIIKIVLSNFHTETVHKFFLNLSLIIIFHEKDKMKLYFLRSINLSKYKSILILQYWKIGKFIL